LISLTIFSIIPNEISKDKKLFGAYLAGMIDGMVMLRSRIIKIG